jgi:hypothetical protein
LLKNEQKLKNIYHLIYQMSKKEEKTKMTYEELEKAYIEEVEWNDSLLQENKQLKHFCNYVHSLRTKEDFLKLRNVVLEANSRLK